jgi:transposase InsO family protein
MGGLIPFLRSAAEAAETEKGMDEQQAKGLAQSELDAQPEAIEKAANGSPPSETEDAPASSPDETFQPPTEENAPESEASPEDDFEDAEAFIEAVEENPPVTVPRLLGGRRKPRRGKRLEAPDTPPPPKVTPEQKLLLLDTWQRSGLSAGDFGSMVGVSRQALFRWKKQFEEYGPAGLTNEPRPKKRPDKISDLTRRAILMMKKEHPEWGCQRISDMLLRGPALPASPAAVSKCLHEAGYELVEEPTRPHGQRPKRFERARVNQLWQTDLFTFTLKRQNRRVHLVVFLDDHSRFIVSYGLHATASTAMVLETLESGIASYGPPEEVLTDNGPQYVTWRGKSAFVRACEKRGIKHIVATPKRPQTLGKTERFWGTLWRECVESAIFIDLGDARTRIGHFIDYYNFHRTHQGIKGLAPADRFFEAAPEVERTLKARVAANALELARNGTPKAPFYVTGQSGGKGFSVHAEGERVIMTSEDGKRQEVDLVRPEDGGEATALPEPVSPQGLVQGASAEVGNEQPPAPGVSPIDPLLEKGEGA